MHNTLKQVQDEAGGTARISSRNMRLL